MRSLTVQRHEPYLITLAQALDDLHILTTFKNQDLGWQTPLEQCPPSITLINDEKKTHLDIKEGYYDVIILHTIQDLLSFSKYSIPKIMILHIALYQHTPLWAGRSFIKWILARSFQLHKKNTIVATTPWKNSTWHLPAVKTIKTPPLPTKNVNNAEIKAVVVGNHLNSRKEVDFSIFEYLKKHHLIEIIGRNPGVENTNTPIGRQAYTEKLAEFHIFIFILQHPWEDAYNLAMLEAMQAGMAILALTHPHAFIKNGVNGYVCQNKEEMQIKLSELLKDPLKTKKMGSESQKIIKENFSLAQFQREWKETFNGISKTPLLSTNSHG